MIFYLQSERNNLSGEAIWGRRMAPKKSFALWFERNSKRTKTKKVSGVPMLVFTTRRQVFILLSPRVPLNIFNTYLMMLCCFRVVLIAA
jgi:hypothetical protein